MVDKRKQGRANKSRGYYYETKLCRMFKDAGIGAVRNPGSGAYKGFEGDLCVGGKRVEVKSRRSGFAYDNYLDEGTGNWILVTFDTSRRGAEPIVRLRWRDFLDLLKKNDNDD